MGSFSKFGILMAIVALAACSPPAPAPVVPTGPDSSGLFQDSGGILADGKVSDGKAGDVSVGDVNVGEDLPDSDALADPDVGGGDAAADTIESDGEPGQDTGNTDAGDTADGASPGCVNAQGCDDGQPCTTDDCVSGGCLHAPVPGCCAADSQCGNGDPCWTGKCTDGSCSNEPIAGCCTAGVCCDLASHQLQAAKFACGSTPLEVEYQCQGNDVQQRQAIAGCDGVTADGCSIDLSLATWDGWKTVSSCDGACELTNSGEMPTCAGGSIAECLENAACDDGNDCTKDTCVATKCQHGPASSGAICGDAAVATEYQCSSTGSGGSIQVRKAWATCSGGSCSATAKQWNPWATFKPCGWSEVCSVADKTKPGVCKPAPECKPGSTCCTAEGQYEKSATACGTSTIDTEYKCEAGKGGKVLARKGVAGCTTYGYCSTGSSSLAWGDWQTFKQCPGNQICKLDWGSQPGYCEGACTPGNTCCTAAGDFSPQATKCSNSSTDSEQKCSGTGKGASILGRKGYPGCTGSSTSCSYSEADIAWGDWTPSKTCAATEVCKIEFGYASCESAVQCKPGATCCTDEGTYAAKGSQCSTFASETGYKCSGSGKGASIEQRKGYDGCSGTSTYCSFSSADTFWGPWAAYKTCAANQICDVSSSGTYASCQDAGECSPTSKCCTPSGDYAAAGTQCGTFASSTEYKCSGTAKGSDVLEREGFSGCDSSGFCSSSAKNLVWGAWSTYKSCSSTQYCKVSSVTYPGSCSATP